MNGNVSRLNPDKPYNCHCDEGFDCVVVSLISGLCFRTGTWTLMWRTSIVEWVGLKVSLFGKPE